MVIGVGGLVGVFVVCFVKLENIVELGYVMILFLRMVGKFVLEMISKLEIVCCGVVDWVRKFF